MRKSFVTVLALLCLLFPLLVACGGQPSTEAPSATDAPAATEESAATEAMTEEMTEEATEAMTEEATEAMTEEATEAMTEEATEAMTEEATAQAAGSSDLKLGLVTDLGKVNDGTFNEFAHMGALRASEELGLEYNYIETQAQADYKNNIQTFVDEGYDIIVTVGFLIQDDTLAAAKEHPEITFIGVDQFYAEGEAAPNIIGIQFREDQAGFLAGAMAGMMTQSNTVGIVAGIDIPPVKRFKNGFDNGAQYVNPDVNLLGVYVPTFTDPAQGASTAEQLIGEGADVVFGAGGPTGTGGVKAAAEQGVYVIGVDQDEYVTTFDDGAAPGADRILTSATKRVDVGVFDQIKDVVDGTFEGNGIAVYEASNDGVGYADFHDAAGEIPDAVKERMEEILSKLADGSLTTGVDPVSGDVDDSTIPEAEPFEN